MLLANRATSCSMRPHGPSTPTTTGCASTCHMSLEAPARHRLVCNRARDVVKALCGGVRRSKAMGHLALMQSHVALATAFPGHSWHSSTVPKKQADCPLAEE